ncbi:unnamed protein product [Durusdinium trenchii]|uniref:Cyclic nucleotide-binding domain-containing protein n=2 Tax=Durusdinium trenchii TaxID=1381693 RepID=A0ABP0P1G8_9DINO
MAHVPLGAFLGYVIGLLILIAFLAAVAVTGSLQPGFPGWEVVEICGPFYQIANFFFFYAGILHDVAFIRTCVVLGFLFITAYLLYGTPAWPQIWEPERAFFRMDSVFWMILALVVNVVPLLRQIRFDDSKVKFCVADETQERWAEAVWREWWRRSGIPRADFKDIVEAGEFLELVASTELPLKMSEIDSDGTFSDSDGSWEDESDVFYYIVTGKIQLTPDVDSGVKVFTFDDGYFVDGARFVTALGQSSVIFAMQQQLPTVKVVSEKALVIRWTLRSIHEKIVKSNGFALECLRLVVASSTLDSLYRTAVKEDSLCTFQAVDQMKKECLRGPLPKNAAMLQRSFLQQFYLSHFTWADLWRPSPRQRAINAVQTGSRELAFRQTCQETDDRMRSMVRLASDATSGSV